MEIGVGAVDFYRFIPDHRLHAELRLPVKFHESRFSLGVDQTKGMDAKSFHEAKRARDRAIGHNPHRHVNAFRRQRYEIPEIIVCGLRLGKAAIGLLFGGMD